MDVRTVQILVVDDDVVDVMAIRRALTQQRIANPVTVAKDGVEALEHLRGTNGKTRMARPVIALVDLNMPRMNGIELLAELRADPELQRMVVFVLSTSKADEDRTAAYAKNVAGYIVKSDAGADFVRLVEMLDAYWNVVMLPD